MKGIPFVAQENSNGGSKKAFLVGNAFGNKSPIQFAFSTESNSTSKISVLFGPIFGLGLRSP